MTIILISTLKRTYLYLNMQGAAGVANLFLPPGKIVVFTVGKDGNPEAQMTLPEGVQSNDPNLPDTKTPLYVLVNSNTASAAEVLAGCLQVSLRLKGLFICNFGALIHVE